MRTILRQLHDVDSMVMTPLRALQLLDDLQQLAFQALSCSAHPSNKRVADSLARPSDAPTGSSPTCSTSPTTMPSRRSALIQAPQLAVHRGLPAELAGRDPRDAQMRLSPAGAIAQTSRLVYR